MLSLRARVLAGLAAVALVLFAVGWAVTVITRDHLVRQVDAQLLGAARGDREGGFGPHPGDRGPPLRGRVAGPALDGPGRPGPERISAMYEAFVGDDGSLRVFFEPNVPGQQFSPPDLPASGLAQRAEPFTVGSAAGDTKYRVVATPGPAGVFVQALPLRGVDDTVERLTLYQMLGLGAVVAVLGAVAWWVVHLGVRPIKQMTRTATAIAAGDLSVRVPEPPSAGTESGELARALNVMLARIEAAIAEQVRSEQRLRRFVADASHELRTPVTTIQGYAELYRHGGLDDPAELADAMRRTEQEAQRMGRLVADMLALAKLDQERPIEQKRVDVTAIVEDAAHDARVTAPERAVSADVEAGLAVVGDEDRLRQVLANLAGNALVHTPAGTPVTLTARRDGGGVVIEVADKGPGMPAEVAARVTERFYRADPSRPRDRGGSGLGMAIVDAVVGAHGGVIVVESAVGAGTTVRVTLPAAS